MRDSRRHRWWCLVPIAIVICFCCSQGTLLGADAHLSWSPSSASDVAGYKVYYGTASRTYGAPINVGNVTTYTLTGLNAGTYYFAVTAYDSSGNEGTFSTEASLTLTSTSDTTAPIISGIGSSLSSAGATVSWTTNEASDSQVEYGTTAAYGSSTTLVSSLITSHSVVLSGLQTSQLYHYRVKSKDAAGNLATSSDFTFTTVAAGSGLVAAYGLNEGSGTTVSDASGNSNTGAISGPTWTTQGKFGKALSFDGVNDYVTIPNSPSLDISGTNITISLWANITSNNDGADDVILAKFWSPTKSYPYYQYAIEFDANGNKTLDFYFADASGTLRGPFSMTPSLGAWTHVAFTYDGAAVKGYLDGVQKFSTATTGSLQARGQVLRLGVDGAFGQPFAGKIDEARIYNRALSQAEIQNDMNSPVGGGTPQADSSPPSISGVGTSSIASTTTIVSWVTNEASDTQVEYGTTTAYGSLTALLSNLVTSHSTSLSGLQPSKLYHYRVKSTDAAGNLATSADFTFTTAAAADTTPPAISAVGAFSITAVGATINWTTNEASDTQVEYGTKTSYGSSTTLVSTLVTSHSAALSGLQTSQLYHYRLKSRDGAGNLATSGDFTFTTVATVSGLVAAYGLNEGSATTVSDASGNSNTGAISGPTWTTQGKFGKALSFDGVNDYVTIPNSPSLDISGTNITISLWANITSNNDGIDDVILAKFWSPTKSYPYYQYAIEFDAKGNKTLDFYFADASGTLRGPFSMTPSLGVWTYVAFTYDGAAVKGYLNGVRKFSAATTGSLQARGQVLRLGVDGAFGQPFAGKIDEARIYNRALSQAEIQNDMNSPVGGATSLSTAPADDSGFVISGVTMPATDIVGHPASPSRDAIFIPSVVDDSRFRTNLGISNLSSSVADVKLTLVDKEGNVLATRVVTVDPAGLEQINGVGRALLSDKTHSAIQGSLILESDQEICAWVVQINNFNNDPSFWQGRRQGSSKILIPSAANLSSFSSSLAVMNVGSTAAEISVRSYNPGGEVMGQTQAPISLAPRGSIVFENVLTALGVKDNFGPVEITSLNGVPLLATSRVSGAKHSAGFFEGLDYSDASTLQIIPSVVENANERTNIGINNVSDYAASVRVRLKSGDGSELGTLRIVVPAKGLAQLNHAARQLIGPEIAADLEGYVELQSDQPIVAWASQINNATNDPAFDVARAHGSSRLLLRSTNGGNFRSNLVVVNIGDADAIVNIVSRDENGEIQGQLNNISIPARGYFSSANILASLGIAQGSGTVEIISANGQPIIATSRVYSNSRMSGFLKAVELD